MTTTTCTAEAYELNNGQIAVFALDGEEAVYSCLHDDPEHAAQDFCAIACGTDPVAEGWEGDGLDYWETAAAGAPVASSAWYRGKDADMVASPSALGNAGRAFAECFAPAED